MKRLLYSRLRSRTDREMSFLSRNSLNCSLIEAEELVLSSTMGGPLKEGTTKTVLFSMQRKLLQVIQRLGEKPSWVKVISLRLNRLYKKNQQRGLGSLLQENQSNKTTLTSVLMWIKSMLEKLHNSCNKNLHDWPNRERVRQENRIWRPLLHKRFPKTKVHRLAVITRKWLAATIQTM